MSAFAIVFPGQGSQSVGMLSALSEKFPVVQKVFSAASDVLDYDLWALVQQGPAEKLDETTYTQPALLAASVAVWECWKSNNPEQPRFLAGHSLGEYTALVCAESIGFQDAIALVAARGQYMQASVEKNAGAMAAIVGLSDDAVVTVCREASADGVVSPANYNSIGQVVVAGDVKAVEKAIELAKNAGAKLAKKIPVSVPSHCILMKPAAEKMHEKLKKIVIGVPKIPVIHNADVKSFEAPELIRNALVQQLISPVRWVETIQFIINQDVHHFLECGPGKVLCGLNKRISSDSVTESLLEKL